MVQILALCFVVILVSPVSRSDSGGGHDVATSEQDGEGDEGNISLVHLEFVGTEDKEFLDEDGEVSEFWKQVFGDIQRSASTPTQGANHTYSATKEDPEIHFVNGGIEVSGGRKVTNTPVVTGVGIFSGQIITPVPVNVKCTILRRPRKRCKIVCRRGVRSLPVRLCPRN